MALTLKYKEIENCYLKAVPTTINEFYIDEVKTFSTYVIYSISVNQGGDILLRDGFEMEFNSEESIFTQIYAYLKGIYKDSIDV